jgi:pyrophosphatase PpaX
MIKVKALLYDFDGTLVNSKEVISQGINQVLKKRGLNRLNTSELREIAGAPLQKSLGNKFGMLDKAVVKACQDDFDIYMKVASKRYKLVDGAKEALQSFKNKGAIQALITSAPRHQVAYDLKRFSLKKFFDLVITRDDVENCKPAPDAIKKALKEFGIRTEEAVYIGDSYIDLVAGQEAGVKTMGVLTGFCDRKTLNEGKPDLILKSVADLLGVVEVIRC